MIERVERFTAELQALAFGDPEILDRRKVDVPGGRTDQRVAPGGSEGSGSGRRKRGRIEPPQERSAVFRQIGADARWRSGDSIPARPPARGVPTNRIERAAALRGKMPLNCQPPDDRVSDRLFTASAFSLPNGQLVEHRADQAMRRVERRRRHTRSEGSADFPRTGRRWCREWRCRCPALSTRCS